MAKTKTKTTLKPETKRNLLRTAVVLEVVSLISTALNLHKWLTKLEKLEKGK